MQEIFKKYHSLLEAVNSSFAQIKGAFPQEVHCRPGCVDCCNACFDISFIEAVYIRMNMDNVFTESAERQRLFERADQAKKQFESKLNSVEDEISRQDLLEKFSLWRVQCPLLNDQGECAMYEWRPVTCRVYGLPTAINGKGHVCGLSGFNKGEMYPTVKLDTIFDHLLKLSSTLGVNYPGIPEERGSKRFHIHEALTMDLDPGFEGDL
ncbi:MAG: YkgJ family cysteine cluster protein [Proteobacteria bacterium]|nr:YkgJ family cysteine cluster protein [Pseudomonadota bacterium]MBU1710242.1 YkgJ family cysteine cluster protein [Pseudomonadota bacterium]